jgi:hypothetical protein
MRYTIDTEFDGHGGPLISLALVPEQGDPFYFVTFHNPADPWVEENVMPYIFHNMQKGLYTHQVIANEQSLGFYLREYLANEKNITIIADSAIDIGRFCQHIHSNGAGQYVSNELEHISFEVHNVDCWPNNLGPDAIQHNAYWDALALWEKLNEL